MASNPGIPGQGQTCFIVAEIGTAHGGDLRQAQRLIEAAGAAGCDCVKFQMVFATEIIHPLTGDVELPGGSIRLFDVFKSLEKEAAFYRDLKEYTENAGLFFLCTPFGLRSARILRSLGVKALKIASPELNHLPLLEEVAGYGLPLLLSSGISTLGDIETALGITGPDTILLHCITQYPAPQEQYNLRLLPHLSAIFGVKTGLSDHSIHPVLVPALAAASGACVVEKHFTLSRQTGGLDDPIALEPPDFAQMVRGIRRAEALGGPEALAWLRQEFGFRRVESVLGSGIKHLAPAEADNYRTTNRSIHALTRLEAGEWLSQENTALLRSEKNLSPGLHPRYWNLLCGKKLKCSVESGQGINWQHLL